jgi:Zn-dependent membrane protease YugP
MPAEQPQELSREASKHAVGRLVIQYRVERAIKRVAWIAAITFVVALILSVPGVGRLIVKLMQI